MEDVNKFNVNKMEEQSKYIRQCRIVYNQDGKEKIWDAIQEHESVSILIYNKTQDCFVLVSQFRPAIYMNSARKELGIKPMDMFGAVDTDKISPDRGVTYELCAGLVDKTDDLEKTAQAECLEECGYKVPLECLEKITTYRSGVGISGSHQTLYYAEVTDVMKANEGGGLAEEGELISVIYLPLNESRKLLTDEKINKPVSLMYALMWFYEHKKRPEDS